MDNNNIGIDLGNIFSGINSFIKNVENAEGMNLPADQKEEFKKQFQEQGTGSQLEELKLKMEQAKKTINDLSNGHH